MRLIKYLKTLLSSSEEDFVQVPTEKMAETAPIAVRGTSHVITPLARREDDPTDTFDGGPIRGDVDCSSAYWYGD